MERSEQLTEEQESAARDAEYYFQLSVDHELNKIPYFANGAVVATRGHVRHYLENVMRKRAPVAG